MCAPTSNLHSPGPLTQFTNDETMMKETGEKTIVYNFYFFLYSCAMTISLLFDAIVNVV